MNLSQQRQPVKGNTIDCRTREAGHRKYKVGKENDRNQSSNKCTIKEDWCLGLKEPNCSLYSIE